jgi:hypothetical protein
MPMIRRDEKSSSLMASNGISFLLTPPSLSLLSNLSPPFSTLAYVPTLEPTHIDPPGQAQNKTKGKREGRKIDRWLGNETKKKS